MRPLVVGRGYPAPPSLRFPAVFCPPLAFVPSPIPSPIALSDGGSFSEVGCPLSSSPRPLTPPPSGNTISSSQHQSPQHRVSAHHRRRPDHSHTTRGGCGRGQRGGRGKRAKRRQRRPLGRLRRHRPVLPLHHRRQIAVGGNAERGSAIEARTRTGGRAMYGRIAGPGSAGVPPATPRRPLLGAWFLNRANRRAPRPPFPTPNSASVCSVVGYSLSSAPRRNPPRPPRTYAPSGRLQHRRKPSPGRPKGFWQRLASTTH